MIKTFSLNSTREIKKFEKMVDNHPSKNASEVIRKALFTRRERKKVEVPTADLIFMSELSNKMNGVIAEVRKINDMLLARGISGVPITPVLLDATEMKKLIDDHIG